MEGINLKAYEAELLQRKETPYTICKDIAICIQRPVERVLGMTKAWSMHQLVKSREIAQKDRIQWWVYRKSLKQHAKT